MASNSLKLIDITDKVPYTQGCALQQEAHRLCVLGVSGDVVFFLEHSPVFTLGRSAETSHLLWTKEECIGEGIEIYETDRGGDITYHGPGQLVAYPIVNIFRRKIGVRDYIFLLEQAVIESLKHFGINANRDERNRGVWVGNNKICAIGVRISHHITMHGLALNVSTNLKHFTGIIPCGIANAGVTSMSKELGKEVSISEVKPILYRELSKALDEATCGEE